jgi:hypothetical protein
LAELNKGIGNESITNTNITKAPHRMFVHHIQKVMPIKQESTNRLPYLFHNFSDIQYPLFGDVVAGDYKS